MGRFYDFNDFSGTLRFPNLISGLMTGLEEVLIIWYSYFPDVEEGL